MKDLTQRLVDVLDPIHQDLFDCLAGYGSGLRVCGYAASILTAVLQKKFPQEAVRIGFGLKSLAQYGLYHFFTEISEKIIVDATFGQYEPWAKERVVIFDLNDFVSFGVTRFDRSNPTDFLSKVHSSRVPDLAIHKTTEELVQKPEEPFIPGYTLWASERRDYTLGVIAKLEEKLGV